MSYTYSAFISYRHLPPDTAAAKAVEKALETYRIPSDIRKLTGRKKLNRCFRDQDELPLADDLGASIEKALLESEWLIVICSPDLPKSAWCCREVDRFISLGRRDRIIPVLISGEPAESYPPQITRVASEEGDEEIEPLAADLRGNLRKQLRSEKLRIVARMLNLNYNDLKKREKERSLKRGLVLVSCVLAAAVAFSVYALNQNRLLTEQRNAASRSATEMLIEKSVRSTADGSLGQGLVYALEAYRGSRLFDPEYNTAVSAALEAAMYPTLYSQIGSLQDNGILHRSASLSNDGNYIACRQADQSLLVYDSLTGEKLYSLRNAGLYGTVFSPDSRYVCLFRGDSEVSLFTVADGKEVLAENIPEGWTVAVSGLSPRGAVAVIRAEDNAAGLYNLFTKELTPINAVRLTGGTFDRILADRSGRRLAWSDGEHVWLTDTDSGEILRTLEGSLGITWKERGEGPYFCYYSGDSTFFLRWETGEEVLRTEHSGGVLSPDGKLHATVNGTSGFTVWDVSTGEELWTEGHNTSNTVYSVAFADNDTLVASHADIQIYRISDRTLVYDSGEERQTYGYDMAAGRLVMPLRSGGCLVNLMPEEEDILPHMIVETRAAYDRDSLTSPTAYCPLAGTWQENVYSAQIDGEWVSGDPGKEGLTYFFNGEERLIYPVRGAGNGVFVSPDGTWQAMLRGQEVDIFRSADSPEPVMTIPGNGYDRLWAALYGDTLALGAYVENLVIYNLSSGECLGTADTGAMCMKIQFSPDGRHIIAFSAMAEEVSVISTENMNVIMRIPVTDVLNVYNDLTVGFSRDGTEAVVLYPDGHADVGLLYKDLDVLVDKAQQYTSAGD
jgi:WD40 repeat protein